MTPRILDISSESTASAAVRDGLTRRVVGQQDAIDALVDVLAKQRCGLYDRNRPISSILLLGPTGSGKTRITEALTETLYGDVRHRIKIDCAEFQHSGEIAKLIGSPPGYLGHRETPPLLNNKRVQDLYTESCPYALLIFDEIEKASDALWHLLLGVLDKGQVTTGYNEEVDLTRTIILMTSNAGSSEMDFALGNGMGFKGQTDYKSNQRVAKIGVAAAKRKFTPEFINRLDHVIACNSLSESETGQIIGLEIALLQKALFTHCTDAFTFTVSTAAREAILAEGFDRKHNARNVKRVLEQRIQGPLGRIVAAHLCGPDEAVSIDYVNDEFTFTAVAL